jgi:hypothetical protein
MADFFKGFNPHASLTQSVKHDAVGAGWKTVAMKKNHQGGALSGRLGSGHGHEIFFKA